MVGAVRFLVLILSVLGLEAGRLYKRRLDEFGAMVHLTTGRDSLDFNSYGNFCGIGGSGTPVDNIDRCCQSHDVCYHTVNRAQCSAFVKLKPYLEEYTWSTNNGTIECSTSDDSCRQAVCHCDKTISECFGKHQDEYNKDNQRNFGKLLSEIQHVLG